MYGQTSAKSNLRPPLGNLPRETVDEYGQLSTSIRPELIAQRLFLPTIGGITLKSSIDRARAKAVACALHYLILVEAARRLYSFCAGTAELSALSPPAVGTVASGRYGYVQLFSSPTQDSSEESIRAICVRYSGSVVVVRLRRCAAARK